MKIHCTKYLELFRLKTFEQVQGSIIEKKNSRRNLWLIFPAHASKKSLEQPRMEYLEKLQMKLLMAKHKPLEKRKHFQNNNIFRKKSKKIFKLILVGILTKNSLKYVSGVIPEENLRETLRIYQEPWDTIAIAVGAEWLHIFYLWSNVTQTQNYLKCRSSICQTLKQNWFKLELLQSAEQKNSCSWS